MYVHNCICSEVCWTREPKHEAHGSVSLVASVSNWLVAIALGKQRSIRYAVQRPGYTRLLLLTTKVLTPVCYQPDYIPAPNNCHWTRQNKTLRNCFALFLHRSNLATKKTWKTNMFRRKILVRQQVTILPSSDKIKRFTKQVNNSITQSIQSHCTRILSSSCMSRLPLMLSLANLVVFLEEKYLL